MGTQEGGADGHKPDFDPNFCKKLPLTHGLPPSRPGVPKRVWAPIMRAWPCIGAHVYVPGRQRVACGCPCARFCAPTRTRVPAHDYTRGCPDAHVGAHLCVVPAHNAPIRARVGGSMPVCVRPHKCPRAQAWAGTLAAHERRETRAGRAKTLTRPFSCA